MSKPSSAGFLQSSTPKVAAPEQTTVLNSNLIKKSITWGSTEHRLWQRLCYSAFLVLFSIRWGVFMCLQAGAGKATLPSSASLQATPSYTGSGTFATMESQFSHRCQGCIQNSLASEYTFIYKSQVLNSPVVEELCFFCRWQNFWFKVCSLYLQWRKKGNQHHQGLVSGC